jgi:hypothetical protein
LLLILVIASAVLSPAQSEGLSAYPSSYSASWGGAKAAYLLLQDLGYQVERWQDSPTEIDNDEPNQVLILAEPLHPPTPEEKAAIAEFLQTGGRIVACGASASLLLPNAEPFQEGYPLETRTKFAAQLPSPLMRGAPEISMIAPQDWHPQTAGQLIIYGSDETAAVVTYSFGKGRVIWWGSPSALTNAAIGESGNLALLLNSVGPVKGTHILWDEYFHGTHGSLWDYFARTPLPWGIVQFGIVFLAVLATYSRRQGPVQTPATVSRLSPLEFVETLGDLYASAHAGSAAVQDALQRLRFHLNRQLGLPVTVPDAELVQAANRAFGWKEEEFSTLLARAEHAAKAQKLPDAETLEIVQQIFDYDSRLGLKHSQKEETKDGQGDRTGSARPQ